MLLNYHIGRRMKDQLDATCYFISLIMRSTCFGHQLQSQIHKTKYIKKALNTKRPMKNTTHKRTQWSQKHNR